MKKIKSIRGVFLKGENQQKSFLVQPSTNFNLEKPCWRLFDYQPFFILIDFSDVNWKHSFQFGVCLFSYSLRVCSKLPSFIEMYG